MPAQSLIQACVDGIAQTQISLLDRGLQFGDGLFETLRVVDGTPEFWDAHLARLTLGCERLGLSTTVVSALQDDFARLPAVPGVTVLKLLLTAGISARGYRRVATQPPTRLLALFHYADPPAQWATAGIQLRFCQQRLGRQPQLAGIKHLNRLEQVLARQEWDDEYQEGLMLDQQGAVIEGTMSNLFIRTGDELLTPPIVDCGVAGVVRAKLLERASSIDLRIHQTRLQPQQVEQADAVFLTNSLIGVWQARSLNRSRWQPDPLLGPLRTLIGRTA